MCNKTWSDVTLSQFGHEWKVGYRAIGVKIIGVQGWFLWPSRHYGMFFNRRQLTGRRYCSKQNGDLLQQPCWYRVQLTVLCRRFSEQSDNFFDCNRLEVAQLFRRMMDHYTDGLASAVRTRTLSTFDVKWLARSAAVSKSLAPRSLCDSWASCSSTGRSHKLLLQLKGLPDRVTSRALGLYVEFLELQRSSPGVTL